MKKLYSLLSASLLVLNAYSQTIAFWDFNSITNDASTSTGSSLPSQGTGTITNIGGTTATFAAGTLTDANLTDNTAYNTTSYPAQGLNSKTAGIQIDFSTVGLTNILLEFEQRMSNTAANTYVLQYTLDRTATTPVWQDAQTYTFIPASTGTGSVWYQRNFNFSSITGMNNNANVAVRIVSAFDPTSGTYLASASTSTYGGTGTCRYDLIKISSLPSVQPYTLAFLRADKTVAENSGTAKVWLKVTTAGNTTGSVTLSVSNASNLTANTDYTIPTLTIPVPNTLVVNDSIAVDVNLTDDVLSESDEYLIFKIASGTNVNFSSTAQHTLYVKDNDRSIPLANNSLQLNLLSSFNNGAFATNSAEISAYDKLSKRVYIANSIGSKLEIVDFRNPQNPILKNSINISSYGAINSVAVHNGLVALAIENSLNKQDSGKVVFLDSNGVFLNQVVVGMMPDMITFNHAGTKVYTANEGEPNDAYTLDPDGSISIINLSNGVQNLNNSNVSHITFTSFNGNEAALRAQGIRIYGLNASASKDFEPEYITVSDDDTKAWVTLQENNALAELNLITNTIVRLIPLGSKNHNLVGNGFDASDISLGINISNYPVKGMYLPDAIGHYTSNGNVYLLTANEGDSRAYTGFNEETTIGNATYVLDATVFPNAADLKNNSVLGKLKTTNKLGDLDNDGDFDEVYVYGGRSFSIINATTASQVYDSGDDLERITANHPQYASLFNASNGTSVAVKNRSDDKGPEPEGIATGTINGRTYAFIALERIGGVMIYDVTNPNAPQYVTYANNRGPDRGAEGILFISADESPNGKNLLILSNETSSTLSIYEVNSLQQPSSSQNPYLNSLSNSVTINSYLTVGDSASNGYKMVGIPDGLGAFDNGNGTFTLLMNHELGSTVGVNRAHGSKGAFVSKWTIDKATKQVLSGSDLINEVNLWNGTGYTTYNNASPMPTAFNRFCSADLAAPSAFYNRLTGLGTKEKLFLNGEEAGSEGRAFAHIASGPNSGKTYELPFLGKLSFENVVANPILSNKTIVASTDDQTPGQVYIYVGNKSNSGNEIEKAGLTGGTLYGIAVNGLTAEQSASIPAAGTTFTLANLGQVQTLTGATLNTNSIAANVTNFLRPEDCSWDPSNPSDLYFATTNSFSAPSRLWKVHFNDIQNPELGGTITAVLDGTEGPKMIDNLTVDHSGHIYLQEDPGNQSYNAKIWDYNISSDAITQIAQHDTARFITGGSKFLTQDEESSGIIDVQSILGDGMFLIVDQAHYSIPGELVEGGQLLSLYNSASASANPEIAVKGNNLDINAQDTIASLNDNTDFGSLALGNSIQKTFEIKNNGTGNLVIHSIFMSGASEFSLVNTPSLPLIIPANGSQNLTVKFQPTTTGIKSTILNILNNDFNESDYYFTVKGKSDSLQQISSSQNPYLNSLSNSVTINSYLTVGDTASNGYKMVGIPDGLGAFDNGNGTFTLLMNHELGSTVGVNRAHGSKGAFVSKWTIDKATKQVLSGSDLINEVNLWNGTGYTTYNNASPMPTAFNRFCSADLAAPSAFYNRLTGLGTKEKLFLNGEEAGSEGRAFAHIASGPNSGKTYELPFLGKLSFENVVANPILSNKTIVASTDDQTPGQVYIYVGNKSNSGNEIEKAGLTGGTLYGIAVNGLTAEQSASIPAAGTTFTLANLGQVQTLTGATLNTNSIAANVTNFLRPEDCSWDPSNPSDLYFATTNSFTAPSRLWKVHFNDIQNPELGGTITAVLDGTEGPKMIDNITVDHSGHIYLQEDPGNQSYNAKIWDYNISSDAITQIAQHDTARFITGGSKFLTQDEESSGIIDVQSILGDGMFLIVDQAHYSIPGELVEGGQLLSLYNSASASANPEIAVKGNNLDINAQDTIASLNDNTDFGSLALGNSIQKTFEIKNNGTGNLVIHSIFMSGASEFSLVNAPSLPLTIPANGTQNLTVKFQSTTNGIKSAIVNILNNDFNESDYYFTVKGKSDSLQQISSSQNPYLNSLSNSVTINSYLTVGDTASNGYKMVGIPDGLGAFDNGNGTFTLLMNHELGSTVGVNRAHGSKGAFVSKWTIDKATKQVLSGSDLINEVNLWNGTGYTTYNNASPMPTAFNRFCSADLAAPSAFYNRLTGLGTKEKLFLNGEEAGNEGRGFAHIVTGPNAGKSYELPFLGKLSFENVVANPILSNKTIVASTDDQTPGQVYIYVGNKSNSGNEIEKAGLTGGTLYGIAVNGLTAEQSASIPAAGTTFTLANLGQVQTLTGATLNTNSIAANVTNFLRPEDCSWDPSNPSDLYFATTNSFSAPSRLWKVHFNDIQNPELGGTITAVLDGTEGPKMIDNITVDHSGHIYLQEDPGNQSYNAKIWDYNISSDAISQIAQHDTARFISGGSKFLTQDEESSGIIDVQSILGDGMFLIVDQAHYTIPGELAEGGQLLSLYNSASASANPEIAVKGNNLDINAQDTIASLNDNTDFGSLALGNSIQKTFEIKNNGTGNLVIHSIFMSGASEFSLVNTPSLPLIIPANGSQNLTVKFQPTTTGIKSTILNILNNDFNESDYYFTVKGNGSCNPSANSGIDTKTVCGSLTWIDGNTYTTNNNTATYTINGGAANGCDSIVTLNLTVKPIANGIDVKTVCGSLTWIDGNTYTANNNTATYTINGGAANGCDSIVTLNLTVKSIANGIDVKTVCGSLTWIDGNTYTTNNNTATYTINGGAANGCDSIVTLNLTVKSIANGVDVKTVCGSLTWIDGNTYTANNNTATYTINGGAANGCDSIVTLNLTIFNPTSITFDIGLDTICNNNGPISLNANPSGGLFSGNNVTNNVFDPTGINTPGYITITYTFTDNNSCLNNKTDSVYVDICTGILDNSKTNLTVIPNPTKGFISINSTELNFIDVEIYSANGQLVYKNSVWSNTTINLEDLNNGLYTVKLNSREQIKLIKILKE